MDENTWRVVQIGMWLLGIQTTIIISIMGAFYASLSKKIDNLDKKLSNKIDEVERKLSERIDKLDVKIQDIDKRVFGIETMLRMQECCMIKDERRLPKAE